MVQLKTYMKHIDGMKASKMKEKLVANEEQAKLSKQLATILYRSTS